MLSEKDPIEFEIQQISDQALRVSDSPAVRKKIDVHKNSANI